ncbi:hypothetical protein [Chitinibacter sp. ZOR0017]|uniref:hypothetical protein n=1 Tax=Chitinibacter sp. ZOR0017 TaxID=1339254 RepID=UPI00068BA0CC|nr:hypothetical protein [Chitinibacter sp. ZOR0017]
MNLLDLLLNRWTRTIVLAVSCACVGAYHGYQWGRAHGDTLLAAQDKKHSEQMLTQLQARESDLKTAIQIRDDLTQALSLANADLAEQRVQLARKVPHVTTVYRSAPDAAPQPLPACVFTTGFVREWNSALGLPEAGSTAEGADQQTSKTESTDGLDASTVTQADILSNHIDNAIRCRAIENQLTGLIDWHRSQP